VLFRSIVNICYAINIHLQLIKGKSATKEELQKSKCEGKLISVNKSWAAVTGQTYNPAPDYNNKHASKNNTTVKNQSHSGGNVTKRRDNSVFATNKTNETKKTNKYHAKNKTYKKFQ
jgi:hypothetical protein